MLPCKKCAYRRPVMGSVHIRCAFRWLQDSSSDEEERTTRVSQFNSITNAVPARAAHWFLFPLNYDPVWGPDDCPRIAEKVVQEDVQEKYNALAELAAMLR